MSVQREKVFYIYKDEVLEGTIPHRSISDQKSFPCVVSSCGSVSVANFLLLFDLSLSYHQLVHHAAISLHLQDPCALLRLLGHSLHLLFFLESCAKLATCGQGRPEQNSWCE